MKKSNFILIAVVILGLNLFFLPALGGHLFVYLLPLLFLTSALLEKETEFPWAAAVILLLFGDLWSGAVWGAVALAAIISVTVIMLAKKYFSLYRRHLLLSFWWLLVFYYFFTALSLFLDRALTWLETGEALNSYETISLIFDFSVFLQTAAVVFLTLVVYWCLAFSEAKTAVSHANMTGKTF